MLEVADTKKVVEGVAGSRLLNFIAPLLENRNGKTEVVKVTEHFNVERHQDRSLDSFLNLHRVNDIQGINRFFRLVNDKLKVEGHFVGCVETLEQRRSRLFEKFPPLVNLAYYGVDFVFKRIFPKFRFTKKVYFTLTGGRNRALSKSEVLGRLVYCGFDIEEAEEIDGKLYFKVRKISEPLAEAEPSTGLLLRIKRIGYRGEPITVYKFRTMHPYAQYIQAYVFEQNDLQNGGKFANDFRITKWGRWMRKFWIDEIPMLYNILRGDLKLVGVRPLSEHYLSLYSAEHKVLRVKGKPGLIPPFYADMPSTLDEIMESESRYMNAYFQDPFSTDLNVCLRAVSNILLKKARSH
ncbi:MAG: sugar transferase [Flavobacteriales bacterium]|nr:sugar transferase [Flavobacteriales bacterium]